jgi:hypothetical protein
MQTSASANESGDLDAVVLSKFLFEEVHRIGIRPRFQKQLLLLRAESANLQIAFSLSVPVKEEGPLVPLRRNV